MGDSLQRGQVAVCGGGLVAGHEERGAPEDGARRGFPRRRGHLRLIIGGRGEPLADVPAFVAPRVVRRAEARAVSRPEGRPGLRLTRRGRIVVGVLAAGVALAVLWPVAGALHAGTPPSPRPRPVRDAARTATVVVGERDTLWDIAVRADPHGDPGATVRRIRDLNGMSGSIVQPGSRLRVPAR
ncbi:LysM domain protein [Actinomadura rubteroloni]|uniref:LysM domain protein n=1 Tax=Actinomadura rubteroloni TaxID=1926885 RepID=A0A2P4UC93_9ACTN|nr:LysM peptidoglycan-binding domain-containing protein [Actinomadura rubteroloni]POM22666.1 LysM domain protein [Actinomadura rubteroloni]